MADVIPPLRKGSPRIDDLLLEAARLDAPPDTSARLKTLATLKAMGASATTGAAAGVAATNWARSFGWVGVKWVALGAMVASVVVSGAMLANRRTPSVPPLSNNGAAPHEVPSPEAIAAPARAIAAPARAIAAPARAIAAPAEATAAPAEATAAPAPLAVLSPESVVTPEIARDPSLLRRHPPETAGTGPRTSARSRHEATTSSETASTPATANQVAGGAGDLHPVELVKPSATSLREEIALLEAVRESLAAADAPSALRSLERHDARFPSGALADEAAVLRVKALMSAGLRDEARRFAQRFSATHPTSTYLSRMRSLLER